MLAETFCGVIDSKAKVRSRHDIVLCDVSGDLIDIHDGDQIKNDRLKMTQCPLIVGWQCLARIASPSRKPHSPNFPTACE